MLSKTKEILEKETRFFIGYPCNAKIDYSDLAEFLKFPINNIGDPFIGSSYRVNTHLIEREVLDFFAHHLHIQDYRGNVTNGGSEGNLQGLYLARENLGDPILFYSADTHYSVEKATRILKLEAEQITSQPTGEIDYSSLSSVIKDYRARPIAICANIGTTMTGAIDSVPRIVQILNRYSIKNFQIHCDAAFFGIFLPFFSDVGFDFRGHASSISISGHKFLGSPIPCGVLLGRKNLFNAIGFNIEYIGSVDYAIPGSRNGITPLILWKATRDQSKIHQEAIRCLELAHYAQVKLSRLGSWRNQLSPIVVFDRPEDDICERWQLAVKDDLAHIIITPGISKEQVDLFLEDVGCMT